MHSSTTGDEPELALQELRRLVHGIRSASYAVERTCGVTGAQLFVLRELSLEPGASIRRLSERTLTDPSSVSVIVARLAAQGLVAREIDDADRRRTTLTLTRRGARILTRAPEPYQGKLIDVLRRLPVDELGVLRRALSGMSDSLGSSGDAPLFFEAVSTAKQPRPKGTRGAR